MVVRRSTSRHAGVLLLEVMFGLALTATLILVLAVSMGTYRRGVRRLSDRRAAIHLAEQTLTRMEEDHAPPATDERIKIRMMPQADGEPPVGNQWARVTVAYDGGEATLIGLVPSIPSEGRP